MYFSLYFDQTHEDMNMRYFPLTLIFLFFSISTASLKANTLEVDIYADAAILINADTGVVLYEKNAHDVLFPASITKVATALFALQQNGHLLDESVIIEQDCIGSISSEEKRSSHYKTPAHWLDVGGTHMGLKRGEVLSLRELFYGMMLISANDASNTIAKHVSGSIPNFMEEMNTYLKKIGCENSHFMNPHGLHHPQHTTTAYDMVLIAREALKHPIFCHIVRTTRHLRPKTNKQESTWMVNSNALIQPGKQYYYPDAIGLKTGYTSHAQHTLIAAARDGEDRTLLLVVLSAADRRKQYEDAINLFNAAFDESLVTQVLLPKGLQKFELKIKGVKKKVNTYLEEDVCITYFPAEKPEIKGTVFCYTLQLPIEKGQPVGEVHFKDENDTTLRVATLFAQQDVKSPLFTKASNGMKALVSGLRRCRFCSATFLIQMPKNLTLNY